MGSLRRNDEGEATIAERAIKERRLRIIEVLPGDATFGGPKLVEAYLRLEAGY